MTNQAHTHTKNTRKETGNFSTAPASGMFQSRPFVVQQQTEKNSKQQDLRTSLMQAERYGHHLSPYREGDRQQSPQQSSERASNRGMGLVQRVSKTTSAPQRHLVSPIQAKLTIGEPGDKYEQEADKVANDVVQRMNAPAAGATRKSGIDPNQRMPRRIRGRAE